MNVDEPEQTSLDPGPAESVEEMDVGEDIAKDDLEGSLT